MVEQTYAEPISGAQEVEEFYTDMNGVP